MICMPMPDLNAVQRVDLCLISLDFNVTEMV
jgi:hypothetical protein